MALSLKKVKDFYNNLSFNASQKLAQVASNPQLNRAANNFQNVGQKFVNYTSVPLQQRAGETLQKVPDFKPFGQYTETLAPGFVYGPQLTRSFGNTMVRAWNPKIATEQYKANPLSTGLEDFSNIPGAGSVAMGIPLLAGLARSRFDAKKVKLATSSIERLGKISRNIDYLQPSSKMSAYTLADRLMKKFLPGMARNPEVKIMAQREPDKWVKLVSTYLDDQLIKAKNPGIKLGFSTEEIKRKVANDTLYDTKLVEKAKKQIGLTARADEAGYVTPDGKMLDFTGRHYASGYKGGKPLLGHPDYLRGQRNVDHREISSIFDDMGELGGTDAMLRFEKAGNIRVSPSSGDLNVSVNLDQKITPQQIQTLKNMHKELGGKIYYDIYEAGGKNAPLDSGSTNSIDTIFQKFYKLQPKNVSQQPLSTQATKGVPIEKARIGQGEIPATHLGRTPLQQVEEATSKIGKTGQDILPQTEAGGPQGTQGGDSSSDIIADPVQKIIQALKEAKPMRGEQEALYRQARAQQAGALSGIGERMGGEKGFYQKLGQLKGELPKVQFESIKKSLSQGDIDTLFNKIESSNLGLFEKVNAQTGLAKLLGERGGRVPTTNEINLLSEVFPPEFIQAVLNNRPLFQKLLSGAENLLNLPRAVMASADLSAPFRQGIFMVGRPKQFISSFKSMFRYAFSENAYKGLAEDIAKRPNYKLMREGKLAITDMGPNMLKREEEFMSNLAERIPVFGTISRGSNRAYSGFLTKLRADTFDDLVSKAQQSGVKVEGKTLEDLASFINSATGRGNLPKTLEKVAPLLNGIFFSPRLMASRINLLNPATYVKYDPFVRKEALKTLLGTTATLGTIIGLAKMGGATVNTDPTNADFAKIKVGNTRYDILGGFQQYIRLLAQLYYGKITSSVSGKVMTLGEGYKPLTRKDILVRFFENKQSPVASFITNLVTGETGLGQEFDLPTEVISRFIPMMAQDIYDLSKERGSIGEGLLMSIPGLFGLGSQTYGKTEYVQGKNKIGMPTSQVRAVPGLDQKIREKVFGMQPLGSTKTFDAETYLEQLSKLSQTEAAQKFDELVKGNPEMAKKINQIIKDKQKGITVNDQTLKQKSVASGDRAIAIANEFKKLKTNEEKAKLWEDYVKKGIITKDVAKQLAELLKTTQ